MAELSRTDHDAARKADETDTRPASRGLVMRRVHCLAETVGEAFAKSLKDTQAALDRRDVRIAALEERMRELERVRELDDTLRSLASRLSVLEEQSPTGSVVDARALLRRQGGRAS